MTRDDEIRFGLFEEKLRQLFDSHDRLKARNLELESELTAVREQLQQTVQDYSELQSSYQNLKAGRVLEGLDVTDVSGTRERLTKLVREVDRCIALINA
jgi:regulator of replication initiation timing